MRALVTGAGCCGASAARRLAELGWTVTVAEKRPHIGGNAYDKTDENGILYHVYGPHIFFTDNEKVWDFLKPFAEWNEYRCSLGVNINDKTYPMPFQPALLESLLPEYGSGITKALQKRFGERGTVSVFDLLNSENEILRTAGQRLYDLDCLPYNQKQWGLSPEELSPAVIARAPVYMNNRREFRSEKFQFMPKGGFTELFRNMLSHPSITVLTETDGTELFSPDDIKKDWDAVLYTGTPDRLLNYKFGRLPYRTLRFELQYPAAENGLPYMAVYYPDRKYPFTRRSDYGYLPENKGQEKTLVIAEIPCDLTENDEPYYVVLTEESEKLYKQYRKSLCDIPHIYAAGRLADYRYYNMDAAVARGLEIAEEMHEREALL